MNFRTALLIASVLLVAAATAMPLDKIDDFDAFKAKFGKSYNSVEEYNVRKAVFTANLAKIAMLNQADDGATYGVNEFADLTEDEFRSQKLGFRAPTAGFQCKGPSANVSALPEADDAVDWRAKGAVTPVKNQGQCGSCWAFSTTGDIEGSTFLATGKLPELSEQDLVDCDKVDQGCGGGLMDQAMESVIKAGGLDSESDYPYQGVGGSCKFDKSKVAATISSYECVKQDEAVMAQYVSKNGPLSIALNAGPMQFYMGGISNPLSILCSPKHLDHGVLIVGYGTEGSKPYWIIKNSWGESWGEKGYYRIIRGKGKCGLDQFPVHSIH